MRCKKAFFLALLFAPIVGASFSPDPPNCEPGAFYTNLCVTPAEEGGLTLLPISDQELLIAGYRGDSTVLMITDPTGTIVWGKVFDFCPGPERLIQLTTHAGKVAGVGSQELEGEAFVFQWDQSTRSLDWTQSLRGKSPPFRLSNPVGNNDEWIFSATYEGKFNLFRIQPESGESSEQLMYEYGGSSPVAINGLNLSNGAMIGVGNFQRATGEQQLFLSRFDETGAEVWTRLFYGPGEPPLNFSRPSLHPDGLGTLILGDGEGFTIGGADQQLIFSRVKENGMLDWVTHISCADLPSPEALQILDYDGEGWLLLAKAPNKGILLLRTNLSGIVEETLIIDLPIADAEIEIAAYWHGQIYITGRSVGSAGNGDIYLAAFQLGPDADNCLEYEKAISVSQYTQYPQVKEWLFESTPSLLESQAVKVDSREITRAQEWQCQPPEGVELCDNGLDDDCDGLIDQEDTDCIVLPNAKVQRLNATCDEEDLVISFRICNFGKGELPPSMPWVLYQPDPRLFASAVMASGTIGKPLVADSCSEHQLRFSNQIGESFFVVLNTDPLIIPPFREWINFPFTEIEEMAYDDNLTSLVFSCNQRIFVPTGFSPNNDGVNDIFLPATGFGVKQVDEFQIYNRWGEVIFERYDCSPNDPACSWDGSYRGKEVIPAVYVWKVKLTFMDGTEKVIHGEVTLVR